MLQPLNEHGRYVADVAGAAPDEIVVQDADDLVVGLSAVDHLEAADDPGPHDDLVACDRPFAEDADVQRVPITPL